MGAGHRTRRVKVKPGDIIAVVLVITASVASMFIIAHARAGEKGSTAVVEVNGREVRRLLLGDNQPRRVLTVHGWHGKSTIVVEGGRTRILKSTCRDKICVGTGWVDAPGESIVCLPNRVVVRVTGHRKPGNVDTVTE